jgi:hypothetical protein
VLVDFDVTDKVLITLRASSNTLEKMGIKCECGSATYRLEKKPYNSARTEVLYKYHYDWDPISYSTSSDYGLEIVIGMMMAR